jgi:hypothetical protein
MGFGVVVGCELAELCPKGGVGGSGFGGVLFCGIGFGFGLSRDIGFSGGCGRLGSVTTAIPATAGDCEFANDVSAAAGDGELVPTATADDSEFVLSATAGSGEFVASPLALSSPSPPTAVSVTDAHCGFSVSMINQSSKLSAPTLAASATASS